MTKDEIFVKLKDILVTTFEIEEEKVSAEAKLFEDLDLDSIDAIDLVVKMKDFTPNGKGNIDPAIFKSVRTVQDVVDAIFLAWS